MFSPSHTQDVLKHYEDESTFLLVGYSFGALLTLKIAKALESAGKIGKVILIDGAPELLQRLVVEQLPTEGDCDEFIQALILDKSFKMALPNHKGERLRQVLAQKGWEAKMRKTDELFNDFTLFSKKYTMETLNALHNRVMLVTKLNLKAFPQLSTQITLVKPTEISLHGIIDADYGLRIYTDSDIDIKSLEGNHMSILENENLPILINHSL